MLVPIREYASAAEMVKQLMVIRKDLMDRGRSPIAVAPPPEPAGDATPAEFLDVVPTVRKVADVVCSVCGVTRNELMSKSRIARIAMARQCVYVLARMFTPHSLINIGRFLDRDHTSVLHGCRKMRPFVKSVAGRLPSDASLREWAVELHKEVYGEGAISFPTAPTRR